MLRGEDKGYEEVQKNVHCRIDLIESSVETLCYCAGDKCNNWIAIPGETFRDAEPWELKLLVWDLIPKNLNKKSLLKNILQINFEKGIEFFTAWALRLIQFSSRHVLVSDLCVCVAVCPIAFNG